MKRITGMLIALSIVPLVGCVPEPDPTDIVMKNDGEELLYRHDIGAIRLSANGNRAAFSEPVCIAKCGLFPERIACAAAAQLQSAVEMQPGDTYELTWDGTYYEIDDERNCYDERTRDADFQLEFCYGHEIDGAFEEQPENGVHLGAYIVDEVCETVDFERGGEVELLAE